MSSTENDQKTLKDGVLDLYCLVHPRDEAVFRALKKFLKPVIRNSKIPIEILGDLDIPPGQEVNIYKQKLLKAEIVIAFISSDLIANEDSHRRIEEVVERYNNQETILLPILARTCLLKHSPFVELQLLPKNNQPLNNKQFWNSEDDALTAVANEIVDAISRFNLRGEQASIDFQLISANWRKSYYIKSFGKRMLAYAIDIILPIIVYLIAIFLLGKEILKIEEGDLLSHLIIYGGPTLIFVFICAGFESSKLRGTPGKIIMRMQTTNFDGSRMYFFRAFLRNVLRFVLGGFWALFIFESIRYFIDKSNGFNWGIILILSIISLIPPAVYFWRTKKVIHDQLSKTDVGERLKR